MYSSETQVKTQNGQNAKCTFKCREYLARMSKLFSWEFSMSHIFEDLIEHNYWSNQWALITKCGTD